MSSSLGWECQKCTYYHKAPGTRCVMCNHLRVTREQMRDFVLGKTLPKKSEASHSPVCAKENDPPTAAAAAMPQAASAAVRMIRNPYAKNKTVASISAPVRPQHQATQSTLSMQQRSSSQSIQRSATVLAAPAQSGAVNELGNRSKSPAEMFDAGQHIGPFHALPRQQSSGPHQQPQWNSVPLSQGSQLNGALHNTASSKRPAQPTKPKSAPTGQSGKNPFTVAVRPPPTPYKPGLVPLCPSTATDWVYPIHQAYPVRDYQLEISKTAVLHNTLVSLPTGLGKTLIAAVVLYNYYRWFPTGKVIFMAPTLPLVNQQVKACYDIMGIPASDTALLTGKVAAKDRQIFWNERRVFFCTPQTVQRDIDAGRCPAGLVVCIVLDEAHKASGNYAYVKVVEQLEQANAKFRILGLSATPGTGIKAIQEVVTALRIHKIEARLDDDPCVKKYIHERHSEIIVVQQVSAVTTIERLLNNLIAPLLDRLRSSNGISMIRGNATLTPYCIIRAKQDYMNRTQDHSLESYFYAAHKLVSIRSDIRQTGIGMVRAKLLAMKNEPRGIMSALVKGKEFQAVLDAVLQSSSDPNNVNETAEDRKLNNPKLMKLDEILTEHFERSRACGSSSRAIVFSQWRDSVSEIVAVLSSSQPLLRPRHFVGQGKSAGGTKNINPACASLKGMKQKEQQQAIKQFQDGTFNILVCTCIGEEGLDIGEVDLIVNFDSLRSPIRMIQRVGRTGRKRDGRVVCLVSEGPEQKTMVASKAAEKTLGRALKRPDAFKITKSEPMFPQEPALRHLDMSVATDFHLSQVGGNALTTKSRRDPNDIIKKRAAIENMIDWRLNEAQEQQRVSIFGVVSSPCQDLRSSDGNFPLALRRRLLRARVRSVSTRELPKESSSAVLGVSRRILSSLECLHGGDAECRVFLQNGLAASRRSRRELGALQSLFPLERQGETESLNRSLLKMSMSAHSIDSTGGNSQIAVSPFRVLQTEDELPREVETVEKRQPRNQYIAPVKEVQVGNGALAFAPNKERVVDEDATFDEAARSRSDVPNMVASSTLYGDNQEPATEVAEFRLPTQSDSSSDESESDVDSVNEIVGESPFGSQPSKPCRPVSDKKWTVDDHRHEAIVLSTCLKGNNISTGSFVQKDDDSVPSNSAGPDISLRLPTQESSSDDDESSEEDSEIERDSKAISSIGTPRLPSIIHVGEATVEELNEVHDGSRETQRNATTAYEDPASCELVDTQDSNNAPAMSSQKETAIEILSMTNKEKEMGGDVELKGTPGSRHGREMLLSSSSRAVHKEQNLPFDRASQSKKTPGFSGEELADTPQHERRMMPALARHIEKVAATPLSAKHSQVFSGEELTDTPQCNRMLPPPSRAMRRHPSRSPVASDDADDIVCSVCFDGNSPDNNPIVLCDGPDDDLSCKIAVHKLCYSINVSLEDIESWRCDVCEVRQQHPPRERFSLEMRCCVCRKDSGALQHVPDSGGKVWIHPLCRDVEKAAMKKVTGDTAPRKRLRKKSEVAVSKPVLPIKSNEDKCTSNISPNTKRRRIQQRMQERTNGMLRCRFLQIEADIDSEEDVDGDYGEEDEARRIEEEEEFNDSFINDTSQLGYTQDNLDRLGLSENVQTPNDSVAVHRALDIERERMNEFATPIFNRRMVKHRREQVDSTPRSASHEWDRPTPQSAPSSQKGLGNMHFIRSVLEHHRNGGDADGIENMYHKIAAEASASEDEGDRPARNASGPIAMHYAASDSEASDQEDEGDQKIAASSRLPRVVSDDGNSRAPRDRQQAPRQEPHRNGTGSQGLTAEQLAMIEAKRKEALRRRQQLQTLTNS